MRGLLLLGLVCCSCSGERDASPSGTPSGSASSTTSAGSTSSAGSTTSEVATLKVIARQLPKMPSTPLAAFTEAGCKPPANGRDAIDRDDELPLDCAQSATFAKLGCSQVNVVGALGALTPPRPIARCDLGLPGQGPGYSGYVRPKAELVELGTLGCLSPRAVRYVVRDGEQWKTVGRWRELEALYAPIESPEEALSWALLRSRSDGFAMEKIDTPQNVRLLVPEVATTYAETTTDGFRLHLFTGRGCGCQPEWLSAHDILVGSTGSFRVERTTPIYRGTADICAD